MNTILSYEITSSTPLIIAMPKRAKILCVQTQNNIPYLWVKGNENNKTKDRYFVLYSNCFNTFGIPFFPGKYIGTFQFESKIFPFHIFEEKGFFCKLRKFLTN